MNRCMLDIETLGLKPGCIILSVGAVIFDEDGIQDEFYETIDMESASNAGLEIDATTLQWWWNQPEEARQEFEEGIALKTALSNFSVFYRDADEIWANSPSMDCSAMEAAYEAVGSSEPWMYDEERCYRTLRSISDHDGDVDLDMDLVEHNALADAKYQAIVASEILNGLEDN